MRLAPKSDAGKPFRAFSMKYQPKPDELFRRVSWGSGGPIPTFRLRGTVPHHRGGRPGPSTLPDLRVREHLEGR